jgi:predicted MFS family arabinose efflux permease
MDNQTVKARKATKAIFLVCGLGISSWAPMVPLTKDRLGLNDANLGLLLLLLGGGAIVMMPICGVLSHRYGTRIVMIISAIIMAVCLPFLLLLTSIPLMALALFIFGCALGTVDVAMNSHGVQVQNSSGRPIMSSLHGLFSVGGLFGALGLGLLIKLGLNPIAAAFCIAALLILIVSMNYGSLYSAKREKELILEFSDPLPKESTSKISWLKGSIIFLGLMCFAVFLSEGAMLDWSAIFLRDNRGVNAEFAGIGYAAFSVAMATMRLLGDKIVSRLSSVTVVFGGSMIAAAGLLLAVFSSLIPAVLIGFILVGIGTANIVPVFFSEGGRLRNIPATVAIPVISTMGYAGQLAGPALLGFLAFHFSLPMALMVCAVLLFMVGLSYGLKNRETKVSSLHNPAI